MAAILISLLIPSLASAYSESLHVHKLPNNLYLNTFNFQFSHGDQYMPLHFIEFARLSPQIRQVEIDLVQGRWQENVMKKVSSFSN